MKTTTMKTAALAAAVALIGTTAIASFTMFGNVAAAEDTSTTTTESVTTTTARPQYGARRGEQGEGRPERGFGDRKGIKRLPITEHAQLLGMTLTELQEALDSGTTLKELAEAKGITEEQLEEARTAFRDERIAEQATLLGITADELTAKLEAGTRMPDILEEAGITQEQWQESMEASRDEHLAELVAAGVITEEQVAELKERRDDRPGHKPGNRPCDCSQCPAAEDAA